MLTIRRAVVHVHSDWSYDGKWSIARLGSLFRRIGVDLVLTAEHSRGFEECKWNEYRQLCQDSSTDRLQIIPGMEYSDAKNLVHILVWGRVPFLGETHDITQLLERVKTLGGVAVLAHPARRQAWKGVDPAWSEHLSGVEIWNRKTDGWKPSHEAQQVLEANGELLTPFVGLDFHNAKQLYPLTMRFRLEGRAEEDSVVAVIREKQCDALAWGFPVYSFVDGPVAKVARWSEGIRKNLARIIATIRGRK